MTQSAQNIDFEEKSNDTKFVLQVLKSFLTGRPYSRFS